jgi:hypothetical protein
LFQNDQSTIIPSNASNMRRSSSRTPPSHNDTTMLDTNSNKRLNGEESAEASKRRNVADHGTPQIRPIPQAKFMVRISSIGANSQRCRTSSTGHQRYQRSLSKRNSTRGKDTIQLQNILPQDPSKIMAKHAQGW